MNINKIMIGSAFLAANLVLLTACGDWEHTASDITPITGSKTVENEQGSHIVKSEPGQEPHVEKNEPEQESQSEGVEIDAAYFQVYRDFLLNTDIDQGSDFPIWGYYLFDMNFDAVPELGVLHDSGGSMGGYFTFYRFDGKEIVPAVLNEDGEPIQISNYTQILADYKHRKTYFLKEMYLLVGNTNGTYGYVREVTDKNGILYCSNMLKLEVDCDPGSEMIYEIQHDDEDGYLSDPLADEYLMTESYIDGVWKAIPPEEYLAEKRALIPDVDSFSDIRRTDAYFLLCDSVYDLMGDDGHFQNRRMTAEEINILFAKWSGSEASERECVLEIEDEEAKIPYETLEAYFQLEQGALFRSLGIDEASACGRSGYLNSHFGGMSPRVGDGIWVIYSNIDEIIEDLKPQVLEIENPEFDLGYMGARAGMNFREIQALAGETELKKGFFYNEANEVYYLEYSDGTYDYMYWSYDESGENTMILISHL